MHLRYGSDGASLRKMILHQQRIKNDETLMHVHQSFAREAALAVDLRLHHWQLPGRLEDYPALRTAASRHQS
jgi:hypothetical protein